jgi:hypothetical protein
MGRRFPKLAVLVSLLAKLFAQRFRPTQGDLVCGFLRRQGTTVQILRRTVHRTNV